MTNTDKVIDLVRKLLAKADSAEQLGSLEEAAAFAAKANELLLRHKLEMSDLDLAAEDVEDPIENDYADISAELGLSSNKREPWLTSLFSHVAKAHFCRALYVNRSKRVRLIGRKSDREIVLYLVTVLARNGRELAGQYARQEARERGYTSRFLTNRAKGGFLVGYVLEIGERLKAMRAEVQRQGGQFALVRFNEAERAVVAAAAPFTGTGTNRLTYADNKAYSAGREAGASVSLHGGLGGSTSSRGTLARGQFLLGR